MKNHRFKNNTRSKPEAEMLLILKELFPNYIVYSNYPYYRFCQTNNTQLLADFYIQGLGLVIEYDGENHFSAIVYERTDEGIRNASEQFKEVQRRDKLKNELHPIIRIPYYEWKGSLDDKKIYLKKKIFETK